MLGGCLLFFFFALCFKRVNIVIVIYCVMFIVPSLQFVVLMLNFFVDDCFTGYVMPIDTMMFTTRDQDNDEADDNCAELFASGWWHKHCNCANPNGLYLSGETDIYGKGITYRPWLGAFYSLRFTELKVRRVV